MNIGVLPMSAIAVALGLDLYARSACHGALLSRINKYRLVVCSLLFAVFQIALLAAGYGTAIWMQLQSLSDRGDTINYLICMIIFASIAVRMLRTAVKNEDVVESRQDEKYIGKIYVSLIVQVGFCTFLTGVALGLVRVAHFMQMGILVMIGTIGIIAGLESGYHFGYRLKTKAYAVGGILLLVTVICMTIYYLL